jgi:hypothetical protein
MSAPGLSSYVIILNLVVSIWMKTTAIWILYLIAAGDGVAALRTPRVRARLVPRAARRKNAKDFSVVPKVELMIAREVWI